MRDCAGGLPVADIDLATAAAAGRRNRGLDRGRAARWCRQGWRMGPSPRWWRGAGSRSPRCAETCETDGRHAVVAFTADWRQDASRRDFTINALSMARDGAVFDYFGGLADLREPAECASSASRRPASREDYLRVLRFFRFYARYGRVPPDPDTLAARSRGIPGLARLSVERVWTELRRILAAPDPTEAVGLMADSAYWAAVAPEASRGSPGRTQDAACRRIRSCGWRRC